MDYRAIVMFPDQRTRTASSGPSLCVEMVGLDNIPTVGSNITVQRGLDSAPVGTVFVVETCDPIGQVSIPADFVISATVKRTPVVTEAGEPAPGTPEFALSAWRGRQRGRQHERSTARPPMSEKRKAKIMNNVARGLREEAVEATARAKQLRAEAAEIERAEREAAKPKEPAIASGEHRVVLFEKYMSGRSYGFAAIGWRGNSQTRWTVTGSDGEYRHTWAGLLSYIGEANWSTLRMVTGTSPLLAPGAEPAASERMGPFGRPYESTAADQTFHRDYDHGY